MYSDRILDDIVNKVARACKEPGTGYVHRKAVVEEVERQLQEQGLPVEATVELVRRVAESETDRYFNRRKPKVTSQESLYSPDFWLPLGDGKRVLMSDAGANDLATYLRNVSDNADRVNARRALTAKYVASRNSALEAHSGKSLHWVEVNLFGYIENTEDTSDYDFIEDSEVA